MGGVADDLPAPVPDGSTPASPGPDGPVPGPGFDPTTMIPVDPYVDDTAVGVVPVLPPEPADQRWSARAGVPAPGTRGPVPGQTEYFAPAGRQGVWWTPILLGVLVVVLVVLLGTGLWLGLRGGATPAPSGTAAPSLVVTTAAAPTTAAPTPSATASTAVFVLPDLSGVQAADAASTLSAAGLKVVQVEKVDGTRTPGVVISTDPPAGTPVPIGGTVTLTVAVPPPSSPPPSPQPSASASVSP